MDWLNYHHLYYFWIMAREGSLARACAELHLSPSAVSGQIKALEKALGEKLFVKSGRGLMLSETGRMVYRYADEIFRLGKELQDTLGDRPVGRPLRLTVGVADVIPKIIARELIKPALRLPGAVQLVCRDDKPERLLAQLALHDLDVILMDAPASPHVKVKAFNHLLGESDITLLAQAQFAARYRADFPRSLKDAPILLPAENTALRRAFDHWFNEQDIRPQIAGEFDDNALLNVFGEMSLGLFPAPTVIADEVRRQFQVEIIGRLPQVKQRFYAVTVERRIMNPAAAAICHEAQKFLSQPDG